MENLPISNKITDELRTILTLFPPRLLGIKLRTIYFEYLESPERQNGISPKFDQEVSMMRQVLNWIDLLEQETRNWPWNEIDAENR